MTASEVTEILDALDTHKTCYWVAGGWAVDALIGVQSRAHDDLDVIIDDFSNTAPAAVTALKALGFQVFAQEHRETWMPDQWILRDGGTRRVDLVSVDWTRLASALAVTSNLTGQANVRLARLAFSEGKIDNRPVPCLSARVQRLFRTTYDLRPVDRLDLARLPSDAGAS